MIKLQGTEKQIKWAEDIRSRIINELDLLEKATIDFRTSVESKRIEQKNIIINAKNAIVNIEDSKELIEKYKDVLNKDCSLNLVSEKFNISRRVTNRAFELLRGN